jgi:alkylhydroperoxidase family enzyme
VTLEPGALTRADVDAVRRAGTSDDAIVDALHVCALFNTIVRIADALDFEIPPASYFAEAAPAFLERGYLPER